MNALEFLSALDERHLPTLDRAIALLWWVGQNDPTAGMSAKQICAILESGGHPKQNASRLQGQLTSDRRTSRAGKDAWRLRPTTRRELSAEYSFAMQPIRPGPSDSVLPRELVAGTRGYIERVVEQINKSYDNELWDCCAVMSRRLLETLIIEVYEKLGRASEIKGSDGHFAMLNGLITFIEADKAIHLGRNALKGLKDHKALGDQSAHNRRFTANRNDIDRVRDGLRVATQELMHLAALYRSSSDKSAA